MLSLLLLSHPFHQHTAAPDLLLDDPPPPPRRKRLLAEPPSTLIVGQEVEKEKGEVVQLDTETSVEKTNGVVDEKDHVVGEEVDNESVRYLELPNYNSEMWPIVQPDGSTVVPESEFVPFHGTLFDPHNSVFITLAAYLPLDVAFTENEDDGALRAAIVFDYGHGYRAGLRWKDRLRAVSACQQRPEEVPPPSLAPTPIAGRAGGNATDAVTQSQQPPPQTTNTTTMMKRFLFSCDGQHLEDVLAAIESNAFDPYRRPILIVVERSIEKEDTTTKGGLDA
jgi:hypothetical protein